MTDSGPSTPRSRLTLARSGRFGVTLLVLLGLLLGGLGPATQSRALAQAGATQQGVEAIGARIWHEQGIRGAGTKVAILDVGFAGYQAQLGRTLPAQVTTRSFRSDGNVAPPGTEHGTQVAEIVHAVAPETELILINYDPAAGQTFQAAAEFAIAQRPTVIQASVYFFGASDRGDGIGPGDDLVRRAQEAGILWVQASGNFGQSHWRGGLTDADGDGFIDFAPGVNRQTFTLAATTPVQIYLRWYDWELRNQDYDLVLESSDGRVVARSEQRQNGGERDLPFEFIGPPTLATLADGTYRIGIRIVRANRSVPIDLFVDPATISNPVNVGALPLLTHLREVWTVGAVDFQSFQIQPYSDRGPTLDDRIKPNIVAPDAVTTTFGVFRGTSAAAPHASGAAALVKQANPTFTPVQIRQYLEARAVDLGPPGPDSTYGVGRLVLGTRILLPATARSAQTGG
ncbi:MAG: S8 family serine peptidase [Chloroflexi bacterium]|nr:S8 family serine peptidase [Chloroflexota bacterium]